MISSDNPADLEWPEFPLGRIDPIDVLDLMRSRRRPMTQWYGLDTPGLCDRPARRIAAELRATAVETRKRIVNGLDVEDQYWYTTHLRAARAQLN